MLLILLGLVQGLTEFFPISSSGHLVILENFLKLNLPGAAFEAFLHFGTIMAVIILFKSDIKKLVFSFFQSLYALSKGKKIVKIFENNPFAKLAWFLMLSSIPAAVIGFSLNNYFEILFNKPIITGFMLSVTGFIIFFGDKIYKGGNKQISDIDYKEAIFIGFAQALAIIPGISRSGMTVLAGLSKNLTREFSAKYSFILSIPIILGATIFKMHDIILLNIHIPILLLSGMTALISSYGAMKIFIVVLKKGKMYYFSYYLWIISALTIYLTYLVERS